MYIDSLKNTLNNVAEVKSPSTWRKWHENASLVTSVPELKI